MPKSAGLYNAPSMFGDGMCGGMSPAGGYSGGLPPGQAEVMSRGGEPVADVEPAQVDVNALTQEANLYKAIAQTFGHILKDNNAKLVANLIDASGKVICDAVSLVSIIAMHVNTPVEQVNITYEDQETGCLAKYNTIRSIKIASLDFNLMYNQKYNILSDDYFISLDKVLILDM